MASRTNVVPPTMIENDIRHVEYNLILCTSVLCAVVAGFAVLMRKIHTNWSPVAIRFAITTMSTSLDHNDRSISSSNFQQLGTQLDFGVGHISPQLAVDLGQILDIDGMEHIRLHVNFELLCFATLQNCGRASNLRTSFSPSVSVQLSIISTVFNKLRRVVRL
ncbi:Subtilisin-like protease SBT1.4 [Camellia lanceoleosa]|uniref:Subtilisin-like protease SBT1.4 n=1 Tax=Camellia lanceoleosa TaxID=1840588 RepID=A0ACC0III8_9ERIC|nr:Subtilisin-like protease SBT1.4 [Camellia lanceoleosa]